MNLGLYLLVAVTVIAFVVAAQAHDRRVGRIAACVAFLGGVGLSVLAVAFDLQAV